MLNIRRVLVAAAVALLALGPVLSLTVSAPPELTIAAAPAREAAPGASPFAVLAIPIAGAIRVKDIGTIAKKFVSRAQTAAPDYAEGVKAAGQDWENNTIAGKDNYAAGVQEAIGQGRFERGIRNAGAAKFVGAASTKGATRFGPGVAMAEQDYVKGAGPALQVIAGLNLPPRRPKGDPGNLERAAVVARALRAFKTGR